jgi:phosphohistidine swiveling domain-containing protein
MFDQIDSATFERKRAGRKAANLHQLFAAGLPVPNGFVLAHDMSLDTVTDDQLRAQVQAIGGFPVAVRSSGELEDLEGASFAGLYETYLEVATVDDLREKISRCRGSGGGPRVVTYLERKGLPAKAARVSVLVQRMVDAAMAGVAFSIDPLTGKEEHALVECCEGLGEKLVSGQIEPSRYRIALETGAIVTETLAKEGARLTPAQARLLAEMLVDIQALFGTPQDVEWAFSGDGTLFVLQSRPVTTLKYRIDVEELTNADFKDGGISARVCTPLMFSLYRNAMQHSMQAYFEGLRLLSHQESWIFMYYGRGYWNASAVKRALGKIPGFDESTFDQDLGIQKSYGPKGPLVTPSNVRTLLPVLPVALALERAFKKQLKVAHAFMPAFRRDLKSILARIERFATTSDSAFFDDVLSILFDFHAKTERTYFTTIYNNATAQSELKSLLTKMDGATGRKTSLITLMSGLDDVHHMDVQRGIASLCRVARDAGFESDAWREALAAFIAEHGFHSDAELDLTVPRWYEVPERIQELVAKIVASGTEPADPDAAVAAQKKAFEEERATVRALVRSRLRWRLEFAWGFDKQLGRVRAYLSAREAMRECSTRCYAIVRAYMIEAGKRLAKRGALPDGDAIFMLSIEEIGDVVRGTLGPEKAARAIRFRRKMYDGYRAFVAPNELGAEVDQRSAESYITAASGKRVLVGLGCSPKVVEGTVCVVPTLDDVHRLRKGDILVTKTTDPAWTPVLGLVAGVITEVGGVLSHAAVIGREYGIAAVLNLPGATSILRSGQRVRVDGSTGVIEILDDVTPTSIEAAE